MNNFDFSLVSKKFTHPFIFRKNKDGFYLVFETDYGRSERELFMGETFEHVTMFRDILLERIEELENDKRKMLDIILQRFGHANAHDRSSLRSFEAFEAEYLKLTHEQYHAIINFVYPEVEKRMILNSTENQGAPAKKSSRL